MAKKKSKEPETFDCAKCDKPYRTQRGLDAHNKKFHEFPCPKCGKPYKTERGRDGHIEKEHPKQPKKPKKAAAKKKARSKKKAPVKKISCPFEDCKEKFATKAEAMEHVEKDHKQKGVDEEPERDVMEPKITYVVPPKPTKSYGRMDFMFKGRRRERGKNEKDED